MSKINFMTIIMMMIVSSYSSLTYCEFLDRDS